MNTQQIALQQHALGSMIGMRSSALPIRLQIEQALVEGQEVVINFTGVAVTQSFVDELLGALILRDGPGVMQRIVLKGCSEETRGIIRFVASDRAEQFMQARH
jgi:hypothetical protein